MSRELERRLLEIAAEHARLDYDDAFSGNGHTDEPDPDGELRRMLVDWPAFWAHDHGDAEWIAEPLLPAKRSVALFAPGGTGKSLLALWLAAKLASGVDPFTGRPQPPINVLYLDYEMTEADLSERLEQMGFGVSSDLGHLHYALLPSLPGLDQPDGGRAVVRLAQLCDASLVVVDTFGRAVHGDENDADTVRAWYRWTGLHLKAEGRGFVRVDHAGKDLAKGQRGTSAKNDDVDVVWQMTARDGGVFVLDAKKRRMGWVPLRVEISMSEEPLTFTLVDDDTWPIGTKEVAQALDELDVELGAGYRTAGRMLREAGRGARNELIRAALKYRRRRSDSFHFIGDNPVDKRAPIVGVHCERNNPGASSGAPPTEDLFDQVDGLGRTTGRTGAQDPPHLGLSGALRSGPTGPADPPEPKQRSKPDPNEDF